MSEGSTPPSSFNPSNHPAGASSQAEPQSSESEQSYFNAQVQQFCEIGACYVKCVLKHLETRTAINKKKCLNTAGFYCFMQQKHGQTVLATAIQRLKNPKMKAFCQSLKEYVTKVLMAEIVESVCSEVQIWVDIQQGSQSSIEQLVERICNIIWKSQDSYLSFRFNLEKVQSHPQPAIQLKPDALKKYLTHLCRFLRSICLETKSYTDKHSEGWKEISLE